MPNTIHPSIGQLNRKGIIGYNLLFGGASQMRYFRNLPYEVSEVGIVPFMAERAERAKKAGVTQTLVRNIGGTNDAMSFAQLCQLHDAIGSLNAVSAWKIAAEMWEIKTGHKFKPYVGKLETYKPGQINVPDAGVWQYGAEHCEQVLSETFPGHEFIIDHSTHGSDATMATITRMHDRGHPMNCEPRPYADGHIRNDLRVGTFTQSTIFRKSMSETWCCPLDDTQNRLHSVFCEDPAGKETTVDEVRQLLGWGIDVYVPLDENGCYLGVRAAEIAA